MRHVILGAGAAGLSAAKTLRAQQPGSEILVLSADDRVHSRCMLHHYISGSRSAESLDFLPPGFFETENIVWRGASPVARIDAPANAVVLQSGEAIAYDKLLIATGAESAVPPVGALRQAPNVYTLRHLCDAEAIRDAAQNAKRAVVVGSGLVGLDAAYALLELGLSVAVVEMANHILPLQLDEKAASAYQRLFEQHGAAFCLGGQACDTRQDATGRVTDLCLADGRRLECDFVVVAAGVRPATAMLEGSGIDFDRAVKVDGHLRTNLPNVYAAGDVTGLAGIWPNAVKMGEVAAMNMCGIGMLYSDVYAIKNTINFFGLATLSVGNVLPEEGDEVYTAEDRRRYKKAVVRQGRLRGILLQGDIDNTGFWQYLIKNRVDLSGAGGDIFRLSYADFYALGPKGGYEYRL